MPLIADYDQDEDEQGGAGGGGRRINSTSGSVLAEPTKQDEPDFVPWERFVSANKDVSQREAGKLSSSVKAQGDDVTSRRDDAAANQREAVGANYNSTAPQSGFGSLARAPKTDGMAQAQPSTAPGFAPKQAGFGQPKQEQAPVVPAAPTPKMLQAFGQPQSRPEQRPSTAASPLTAAPTTARRTLNPDKLKTDVADGAFKTSGHNLSGWKDIEAQLGANGWGDLVGDTVRAQSEAEALGSEGGVAGLLRQQTPTPNSAFDAALLTGEGGERFRELQKKFGGGALTKGLAGANKEAQSDWAKLMGDVDAASAARDAEIRAATENMDRLAIGERDAAARAPSAGAPTGSGYKPGGYDSYNDFREQLAVGGGVHGVGEDLSLADQLINKLGEGGFYEGKNVAGTFRDSTLGDGLDGVAGSLDDQNRYGALQNVEQMYGSWAAEWVWSQLTEDIWNSMGGKNMGAIYRTLANLIEQGLANGTLTKNSAGQITPVLTEEQRKAKAEKDAAFTKSVDIKNQRTSGESVTSADGKTSRAMTPEQKYERDWAYQAGWGEEWDRQFLGGSDKPTNTNSQSGTGSSGQLTYDADGNVVGLT